LIVVLDGHIGITTGKVHKVPETKEEVREILGGIPSASTYGATTQKFGWKSNTDIAPYIAAHRCNSGTPIVLLDPVLSELYDDIVKKHYVPSRQDCISAKNLMQLLSAGFLNEVNDMQPAIKKWASDLGTLVIAINGSIL
jgi:hypothetical protein